MDLITKAYIFKCLKIEVNVDGRGVYEYTGQIDRQVIDGFVADAHNPTEWQNPNLPDCGNNDGILYVYLPLDEEIEQGELFIGIDTSTHTIYVS